MAVSRRKAHMLSDVFFTVMMVNMLSVVQRIILFTFGELNTDFLPRGETKTSFMRASQVRQI